MAVQKASPVLAEGCPWGGGSAPYLPITENLRWFDSPSSRSLGVSLRLMGGVLLPIFLTLVGGPWAWNEVVLSHSRGGGLASLPCICVKFLIYKWIKCSVNFSRLDKDTQLVGYFLKNGGLPLFWPALCCRFVKVSDWFIRGKNLGVCPGGSQVGTPIFRDFYPPSSVQRIEDKSRVKRSNYPQNLLLLLLLSIK